MYNGGIRTKTTKKLDTSEKNRRETVRTFREPIHEEKG